MKKVEIGKAVSFGWEAIKKDLWYFVGIAVVYFILTSLFSYHKVQSLSFINTLVSIWLSAGLITISLAYYAGKKLSFETLFTQVQYFLRLLGANILVGLIIIGGLILLIVPGIYWALKYQFVSNIILDKNVGILEAMGKSGEITKGIKMQLLLFDLTLLGIMILGAIALGVGILVAFPITFLASIFVYKKLIS